MDDVVVASIRDLHVSLFFEMMTRYHFVLDDDYDEIICMYMLRLHLWSRRHLYVYHDDICMC